MRLTEFLDRTGLSVGESVYENFKDKNHTFGVWEKTFKGRIWRGCQFCLNPELIENYESAKKDNFKGWACHHRLETHTSDGEKRLVDLTREELKAFDMYYNRPPQELIYLKNGEHASLHNKGKYIGEINPNYGKHLTEEQKIKISNSMKGHKSNSRTLTHARRVKKWGLRTPLYTSEFFAKLDPNISYADFKRGVSKSFYTWKKFQKYLEKN